MNLLPNPTATLTAATVFVLLHSPKGYEQAQSLGKPMQKVIPAIVPIGFSITNFTVTGNTVILSWQAGATQAPWTVWGAPEPSGPWTVEISPLYAPSATFNAGSNRFFKVQQPPTNTIAILETESFGIPATNSVYWAGAWIDTLNFTTNDCAVGEGCNPPGTRKLLRFPVTVWNPNAVDNFIGPTGAYFFDPCHRHFHMTNFSEFSLTGTNGFSIASQKMGWCVASFGRLLDLGWNTNPAPRNCTAPQLTPGWGDTYSTQPCMWLDITGAPDGVYTLSITLDPTQAYGFYTVSSHDVRITGNSVVPWPAEPVPLLKATRIWPDFKGPHQ